MVSCIQFTNSYQQADVLTFEIVLNHYFINESEPWCTLLEIGIVNKYVVVYTHTHTHSNPFC